MRKYEIMFIVKPTLEEAAIKKIATEVEAIIKKATGKVIETKDMGQKDLAYEIQKHKRGYYFLLNVEGNAEVIEAFNHFSNVSEDIIRSLVVKIED